MRLEQLAFFASVLVGIEVAMVTLALALGGYPSIYDISMDIDRYIHVWITDLGHTVDISMDM